MTPLTPHPSPLPLPQHYLLILIQYKRYNNTNQSVSSLVSYTLELSRHASCLSTVSSLFLSRPYRLSPSWRRTGFLEEENANLLPLEEKGEGQGEEVEETVLSKKQLMGIPNDDVVSIEEPESAGDPTVITVSCPDKTGLGCDLCRIILLFGLNIVKGDISTDGRWCYIVFWVLGRNQRVTRWPLLKKRLLEICPVVPMPLIDEEGVLVQPQVYLLKFSCYDRMGLLYDVTQVLCELELTIRRVKVSTTPDGHVLDLFFITDNREQLHLKMRKDETHDKLSSVLGDSMTCCEIDVANDNISYCVNTSLSLPPTVTDEMFTPELPEEESSLYPLNLSSCNSPSNGHSNLLSVKVDNMLSPAHTLIQIQCGDYKGLLYDIMRTLKDYNIQLSYGRFYRSQNGICEIDLFVVQMSGAKIIDPQKQESLCLRLRMELFRPLLVILANRGPDKELLVANPVECSGKGRPLVFHDITHALKILQVHIFLAEIGRHMVGGREWEVYRVHLGEGHELSVSRDEIEEQVRKKLMGWD